MGEEDQLCLQWNDFQVTLTSAFADLRREDVFVDVTLACEGRQLQAHKLVLSACSPFFKELLQRNPCQHPIIILQDVRFQEVAAIIDFVYKGEVYIRQENLNAFLQAAGQLKIHGLSKDDYWKNFRQSEEEEVETLLGRGTGEVNHGENWMLGRRRGGGKRRGSPHQLCPSSPPNPRPHHPAALVESERGIKMEPADLSHLVECTLDSLVESGDGGEGEGEGSGGNAMDVEEHSWSPLRQENHLGEFGHDAVGTSALSPGENSVNSGRSHKGGRKRNPVLCPICSKSLSRMDHLRSHLMYIHSSLTPKALCKFCNRVFKNAESLRSHIGLYHKGRRRKQVVQGASAEALHMDPGGGEAKSVPVSASSGAHRKSTPLSVSSEVEVNLIPAGAEAELQPVSASAGSEAEGRSELDSASSEGQPSGEEPEKRNLQSECH